MTIETSLPCRIPATDRVAGDVARLRHDAERVRRRAAERRADGGHEELLLARVADFHALAYDELANAAQARGELTSLARNTKAWQAAVERARGANRRAEEFWSQAKSAHELADDQIRSNGSSVEPR
ncbi:hypothetical protein [Amycolatopsis sp. cmx-4-54]|uniref:hypothetical protein n=1 Tax=Amycolatopsis sp. cmx-4-54 TaxID=2790936 RepID=UPI00397BF60E